MKTGKTLLRLSGSGAAVALGLLMGCSVDTMTSSGKANLLLDGIAFEDVSAEYGAADEPDGRGVASEDAKKSAPRQPWVPNNRVKNGEKAPPIEDSVQSMHEFTDEELAYGLRAVTSVDGKLYRETEPRWDLAKRAKASPEVKEYYGGDVENGDSDPNVYEALADVGDQDAQWIWGTDDRANAPQLSPYNKVVSIGSWANVGGSNVVDNNWCTGTIIGWRTVLTAAHCLTDGNGNIGTNLSITPYQIGNHSTHPSGWAPYGWKQVPNGAVRIPAQYIALDSAFPGFDYDIGVFEVWDFAVIIFPQEWYALQPGYTGFSVNRTPSSSTSMEIFGYPADCPFTTHYPFLCGDAKTGGHSVRSGGIYFETSTVDTSGGHSGGPWWFSTDRRPMAVHTSEVYYFDFPECGLANCMRNRGRRIDNTLHAFIQAQSNDY